MVRLARRGRPGSLRRGADGRVPGFSFARLVGVSFSPHRSAGGFVVRSRLARPRLRTSETETAPWERAFNSGVGGARSACRPYRVGGTANRAHAENRHEEPELEKNTGAASREQRGISGASCRVGAGGDSAACIRRRTCRPGVRQQRVCGHWCAAQCRQRRRRRRRGAPAAGLRRDRGPGR